ncbi:MAG: hypothetical protein WCK11_02475 [Candidatus Falkowbacteria bacterium]
MALKTSTSENKKPSAKTKEQEVVDEVVHTLRHAAERLASSVKEAKDRYDRADEKTKKKIIAGMAGAAAFIAAAIGVKKALKKKK